MVRLRTSSDCASAGQPSLSIGIGQRRLVYLLDVDPIKESRPGAAGLCDSCRHRKDYRNDRGSVFLYCRKSESDPRYPKYPPLPVLACKGHEPATRP